jgi:hypothetical protein
LMVVKEKGGFVGEFGLDELAVCHKRFGIC